MKIGGRDYRMKHPLPSSLILGVDPVASDFGIERRHFRPEQASRAPLSATGLVECHTNERGLEAMNLLLKVEW